MTTMSTSQPTLQHAVSTARLPLQLMEQIVDALSDDVDALTACALSSRQLAYRSRYQLFRAVHFDFIPSLSFNHCVTFSEKCQNAAPLVRSLTLSETPSWSVGFFSTWVTSEPQLPIVLGMMKNLMSLHLVDVELVGINIIWPEVEELEMKQCSVTNLGTFLGGFHKLNKLALCDIDIVEETSSSSEVSLDLEELVITQATSRTKMNTIKCLLPLLPTPSRIRRLTYPLYYPEQKIPQYDVIPHTHLDELFLMGAKNPKIPVPDIQNVTKLRLLVMPPWHEYPVDACKEWDELTDWLIHLLHKAQGGCLKELQLEYYLVGISGSPDKWAELNRIILKMGLSKVELVLSMPLQCWLTEEGEESDWPLWKEELMTKCVTCFEQVKRHGLLTVSRGYQI
ncbi:uncharacterized protein BT62DRAFT_1061512, partial [Guyanagaster necrorhizus]